ncbi:MAG: GTPase HflX [Anaerolineales bacterium]|nr:GTPase HflX [Anaerolineales bacterium]
MTKNTIPTERPKQRAFLIGAEFFNNDNILPLEESMQELAMLADTAGLDVVGMATQRLKNPDPKTFLGSGKVQEVKLLVEDVVADMVIFDDELSPRHQRELEKVFGENVQVLDRTALILDIFAMHAQTREGGLQVELAQYEYRLPRLTRAWTHLARQAGGGGGRAGGVGGVGLRGPGETQLEVDRREISRRIGHLREELEKVRAHRSRYRQRRQKQEIPVIALVGYTNAGKSTLLNQITDSDVYVADKLFATLDPTTRKVSMDDGREVLVTDTVGFIQKLPTQLVAAFRATLEEITEADLLVHVVDSTHPSAEQHALAVSQTLEELEAHMQPMIVALNKIDALSSPAYLSELLNLFDQAVPISGQTGAGIPELMKAIARELFERKQQISVRIPYKFGKLISQFYDYGQIQKSVNEEEGIFLQGAVPDRLASRFEPFAVEEGNFPPQE